MSEGAEGKVSEKKQQSPEVERQQHREEGPLRPSVGIVEWVASAGGAGVVPSDRLRLLRAGVGRGTEPVRTGYALHLQRTQGNWQLGRVLAELSQMPPRRATNPQPSVATEATPVARRQPVHGRSRTAPAPHAAQNGWGAKDLLGLTSGASAVGAAVASSVGGLAAAAGQGEMALLEQAARTADIPIDTVLSLVQRAPHVLQRLIADPGGFIHHVLDAVTQGFHRFQANIRRHIMNGLFQWLTGSFKGAIKLPERFDLRGIFGFVLQVLDLTVEHVKERLALRIGRRNVKRIEMAWATVSRYVSAGVEGLWELVQGHVGELKDRTLKMIEDWAITKIVEQGIIFVLSSFNPAGALIQVLRAVWHVLSWLREKGGALLDIAEQVTESIGEIADGAIGHAAGAIEQTLSRSIAPVLSLLARLLGLGGIPDQIKGIVEGVRDWVDRAIDAAIDKLIVGVKWLVGNIAAGEPPAGSGRGDGEGEDARLDAAIAQAVAIAGRFAKRRVRAGKLRPLMQGIKHRYRLRELHLVPSGPHWVVRVIGDASKSEETEAITPELGL